MSIINGDSNVQANTIVANAGLGIDLDADGVSPNDSGDGDGGPNDLQNFPTLTSAVASGATLTIAGDLADFAAGVFRLEFFGNDVCDPSGHGEGQVFLGAALVSGGSSFSLPGTASASHVTATATDTVTNETSEFSACIVVTDPSGATATPTVTASPTPTSSPLDHFSCYIVRRITPPSFPGFVAVPLTDRFSSRVASGKAAAGLCAPTNKNSEDPTAPGHPIHLVGHKVKQVIPGTAPFQGAILEDQFGVKVADGCSSRNISSTRR